MPGHNEICICQEFCKAPKKELMIPRISVQIALRSKFPLFLPSVIKYWKIAVRYDLYLASARFLGFEKCAIDRLCRGKVIRHATVLCASFMGNKNQVAT